MDKSEYLQSFGVKIKSIREAQGLTQEELAWKCGFHNTYISLIERGHRNPVLTNVVRLALGLNVPVSHIISDPEIQDEEHSQEPKTHAEEGQD